MNISNESSRVIRAILLSIAFPGNDLPPDALDEALRTLTTFEIDSLRRVNADLTRALAYHEGRKLWPRKPCPTCGRTITLTSGGYFFPHTHNGARPITPADVCRMEKGSRPDGS